MLGPDDSGYTRDVPYTRRELWAAIGHFAINCFLAAMLGAIFGSLAVACLG
jgi:hypothetical protein